MQVATRRRIIVIVLFLLFVFCVLSVRPVRMRYALKLEHERHRKLTADIHVVRAELDRYKAIKGSYPTTEEGLQVLSDRPKDPWGRDYVYRSPGIPHYDPYDVFSVGPDGKPNTADDDWGD